MESEKKGDIEWRANTLEEKRKMRKRRNKKKKQCQKAKKQKMEEDARIAFVNNTKAEADRYKQLAVKYSALWKLATKRKDKVISYMSMKKKNVKCAVIH